MRGLECAAACRSNISSAPRVLHSMQTIVVHMLLCSRLPSPGGAYLAKERSIPRNGCFAHRKIAASSCICRGGTSNTPGREAAGADSAGALSTSNNDSPRRRSPRRGQASNGDSNQSSPLGGTPRSNALQRAPAAPLPSAPPRSPPRSSSSASMSDGVRKAWVAFAVNKKPDDWASVGACCWPARSSGGFLPSTKS